MAFHAVYSCFVAAETPSLIFVTSEHAGKRVDQFLVTQLPDISRARVQEMISQEQVLIDGCPVKPALRLTGDEQISILGAVRPPPLRALPEDIPLDVVYEDEDLAVINKPAGMMVHVGAGATDDARNRGTLVNALLHRFAQLSTSGGELRPGIVHRLDKGTSGLLVVAKNDLAHRKLAEQFASRRVKKTYLALVQGWLKKESGTVSAPISRDAVRRNRMTTRRSGGRAAVTHYAVQRRLQSGNGKFTLIEVKIETGRTHQIRVHMASIGHPVAGDKLYGASGGVGDLELKRNFLHARALNFDHPRSGEELSFSRPLPEELRHFLARLEAPTSNHTSGHSNG